MPTPSSPPRLPAAALSLDRFQIHAGAGQGPAVSGPRGDPRADDAGADRDSARDRLRRRRADADQLQSRRRRRLAPIRGRRRRRQGQGCRFGAWRPRERRRRRQLLAQPRFTARVAVGAERGDGHALLRCASGDNVSLDLGGSYSLSRRIALTGGVRYQIERDRISALSDDRRDSQAVYIGTAFKF